MVKFLPMKFLPMVKKKAVIIKASKDTRPVASGYDMKMSYIQPWPEIIATGNLHNIDNKTISNIMYRKAPDYDMSYRWDSNITNSIDESTTFFRDWDELSSKEITALLKLKDELYTAVLRYAHQIGIPGEDALIHNIESFFNIGQPGSFQEFHHHKPESLISLVYYVEAEENQGDLVFEDPALKLQKTWWSHENNPDERLRIPPKTGEFRIFRSHVMHQVNINTTMTDRLSVSCNYICNKVPSGQGYINQMT